MREAGALFSAQVATSAILPCEVTGEADATIEFSWLKDSRPLATNERVRLLDPASSGNLQIENVEFADAGSYQCIINTTHSGLRAPQVLGTITTMEVTGQCELARPVRVIP